MQRQRGRKRLGVKKATVSTEYKNINNMKEMSRGEEIKRKKTKTKNENEKKGTIHLCKEREEHSGILKE